jgi:hypothetical protein
MTDEDPGQEADPDEDSPIASAGPSSTSDLPDLGTADDVLAAVVESHDADQLDSDHRRRWNEAGVHKLEILNEILGAAAAQAEQDRDLRKAISNRVFWAIVIQVLVADVGIVVFAIARHGHVATSIVNAWLGATVIQVIAVGIVIAKSLFPSGGVNPTLAAEAVREAIRLQGQSAEQPAEAPTK